MAKLKLRWSVKFTGVSELAKELGVSAYHLSQILHGHRTGGAPLMQKLKERGLHPEQIKARSEQWL